MGQGYTGFGMELHFEFLAELLPVHIAAVIDVAVVQDLINLIAAQSKPELPHNVPEFEIAQALPT